MNMKIDNSGGGRKLIDGKVSSYSLSTARYLTSFKITIAIAFAVETMSEDHSPSVQIVL